MEDEQVKKLAEMLKSQGLAVSMYEAMEKARSIIGVKSQREDTKQETSTEANAPGQGESQEKPAGSNADVLNQKSTLNELMQEAGVAPEQVEEQERKMADGIKEEVSEIKEELQEAREDPEKIHEVREEIAHVKKEMDELAESPDEQPGTSEAPEVQEEAEESLSALQETSNDGKMQNTEDAKSSEKGQQDMESNAAMPQESGQPEESPQAEQKDEQDDGFKEEKSIDLTKVFNFKK